MRGVLCWIAVAAAIVLGSGTALADEPKAATVPTTVIEIAPPPPEAEADVDALRAAAEAEAAAFVGVQRPVVITVSLRQTSEDASLICNANATVRDAKTGNMLVIVEAEARTSSEPTSDQRRAIASAVVGRAVRNVPTALDTK
jgi:hypothetical protein